MTRVFFLDHDAHSCGPGSGTGSGAIWMNGLGPLASRRAAGVRGVT